MDEKATRMLIVSICNRCNSCDVGLPLVRLSTTLLLGYRNTSYSGVALPKLLVHTVMLGCHNYSHAVNLKRYKHVDVRLVWGREHYITKSLSIYCIGPIINVKHID